MLNASDGRLFTRNSCLLFEITALLLFLLLSLLCQPFFASCLVFLLLVSLTRQGTVVVSRQYGLHRTFKYYTVFAFSSHVARIELHRSCAKPDSYLITSPRFATFFFFATIHKNGGFENRSTEISNYKDFQKGATMNTGCDVKKQRSRSEMSASPIYHLNHSRMRFVKLLKLRPLNILREVQWSQMSVKMLLKSQIEARSSSRDLIRKIKCLHYSTVKKKINTVTLTVALTKAFCQGFEHIKVNVQF